MARASCSRCVTPGEHRRPCRIRIELEKLVVRSLVGRLDTSQIARLHEHVGKESAALGGSDAGAIRLATDFHVMLAEMSGKPVLIRYLREVCNRCALTLSVFGRPHSSECAVNEHNAIIAAIERGDVDEVTEVMHHHMVAVADRALLPQTPRGDLMDVLAPYLS
jgi:DNA-binding GntR family transcriptional regulator